MLVGGAVAEQGFESVFEYRLCAAVDDAMFVFYGHLDEGYAAIAIDAENQNDGFGQEGCICSPEGLNFLDDERLPVVGCAHPFQKGFESGRWMSDENSHWFVDLDRIVLA